VKHDIFGIGAGLDLVKNLFQANAFPLANDAPSFDAVVAGNLSARRQRFQIGKRKIRRLLNQTFYLEFPVTELTGRVSGVSIVIGGGLPLARNFAEISFSVNSWASLCRPATNR
jgi:hypothetical protein